MIRCLDTLNELVQGPCLQNQIAVSESKFLDIAGDLFTLKSTKESDIQSIYSGSKVSQNQGTKLKSQASMRKKNKNDGLAPWMVVRMQTKCLILVLSLLEMRDLS